MEQLLAQGASGALVDHEELEILTVQLKHECMGVNQSGAAYAVCPVTSVTNRSATVIRPARMTAGKEKEICNERPEKTNQFTCSSRYAPSVAMRCTSESGIRTRLPTLIDFTFPSLISRHRCRSEI